jgi:hypothetical protein
LADIFIVVEFRLVERLGARPPKALGIADRLAQHGFEQGGAQRLQVLAVLADRSQFFTMAGVGFGVGLVTIGLPGLGQQDQRRRIGCLQAEGEVEQNERIQIEAGKAHAVGEDPERDDECLGDQEMGRTEIARERFGFLAEPVAAEYRRQVAVGMMETQWMPAQRAARASLIGVLSALGAIMHLRRSVARCPPAAFAIAPGHGRGL